MIWQNYENNGILERVQLFPIDTPKIIPGAWIDISTPTAEEVEWMAANLKLPPEFMKSVLDEEESSHVDTADDSKLIVIDVPILNSDKNSKNSYTTMPFSIIHTPDNLITVSTQDTYLIKDLFAKNKKIEPHKRVRLTLLILFRLAMTYIAFLKKIDEQTRGIEKELQHSMRNKEIFELMELNKSLVYFSTALNANKGVVQRLIRSEEFKKFEDDLNLLDDTVIELNQAIEMCSVFRDILAGTMDAFASIISNNLNIVMKVLTIITIVLSLPTLVASVYGMNFAYMPLTDHPWGFYLILGLSFVISIVGAVLLYFYTKKVK
jgi:magnesium transporter